MSTVDGRELNIVNEVGEVIGVETIEKIHQNGLLHREVHVWFYTPKGELVLQHRAKNKDTYPDLLDATVGGHVEIGSDFMDTAVKEMEEETGVKANADELIYIRTVRKKSHDSVTGKINNTIRAVYAYRYAGEINNLRVEKGKSLGFEAWPFEKIFNLTEVEKKKFVPMVVQGGEASVLREIQKLSVNK